MAGKSERASPEESPFIAVEGWRRRPLNINYLTPSAAGKRIQEL
jgi:hypothetical protein